MQFQARLFKAKWLFLINNSCKFRSTKSLASFWCAPFSSIPLIQPGSTLIPGVSSFPPNITATPYKWQVVSPTNLLSGLLTVKHNRVLTQYKDGVSGYGVIIVKIWRSYGSLIFTMGNTIPGKNVFLLTRPPARRNWPDVWMGLLERSYYIRVYFMDLCYGSHLFNCWQLNRTVIFVVILPSFSIIIVRPSGVNWWRT